MKHANHRTMIASMFLIVYNPSSFNIDGAKFETLASFLCHLIHQDQFRVLLVNLTVSRLYLSSGFMLRNQSLSSNFKSLYKHWVMNIELPDP